MLKSLFSKYLSPFARLGSGSRRFLFYRIGLLALFGALYALGLWRLFPIKEWVQVPSNSFAKITDHSFSTAMGLAVLALLLVLLSWQMWKRAWASPGRVTRGIILAGWLAASFFLLWTYPGQSTDWGDYTFRAHMLIHLGKNPLTTPPAAVISHDDFPYLVWYDEVDPYGPAWQVLAVSAHALAGEDMLANLLAFKVIALLATGVSGALIFSLLQHLSPRRADAGLALWLWNPLVLNEGVLHGHNDLVMVTFILGGLWMLFRKHTVWGLVFMVLAGLVKATAWVLLPVAILWVMRERGWRKSLPVIMVSLLCSGVLVSLAYLPFGSWLRLLDLARNRSWWPAGTWTASIFFALRDGLGWPQENVVFWVTGVASLLFIVLAVGVMFKVRDLQPGAWAVALAYLLIGYHWFQPWYAILPIALASIICQESVVRYTLLLTFFMLLHPIVSQFFMWGLEFPPGGYDFVMAGTILLAPQIAAIRLLRRPTMKLAPIAGI